MRRLGRRAILLFSAYAALILAMVVAGFLSAAVGVWASVLWGVILIAAIVLYIRIKAARTP